MYPFCHWWTSGPFCIFAVPVSLTSTTHMRVPRLCVRGGETGVNTPSLPQGEPAWAPALRPPALPLPGEVRVPAAPRPRRTPAFLPPGSCGTVSYCGFNSSVVVTDEPGLLNMISHMTFLLTVLDCLLPILPWSHLYFSWFTGILYVFCILNLWYYMFNI